MSYLRELNKELDARGMADKENRKIVMLKQAAYVKDHPVCEDCGETKNLTYDHIIPKKTLFDFNVDCERRFIEEISQTLCSACNHLKSDHLIMRNPKTKILLIKLLNEQL